MSVPVIGVTPTLLLSKQGPPLLQYVIQKTYTDAVLQAGGVPVLLIPTEDEAVLASYRDRCDGFLFSGGPDVSPACYGEQTRPACGSLSPERDAFELALLRLLLRDGADRCPPIFAICRGMQVLNVALGGTLYQDIVTEYPVTALHRQPVACADTCHEVRVLPETPLADLMGEGSAAVNSYHHQAVKALAAPLAPAAYSEDGLLEALYLPHARFLLGVQWHPERILQLAAHRALFRALVTHAARRA